MTSGEQDNTKEGRILRILDTTLEVFSEFSFEDATTSEIAQRARVSKRDLYAFFPNKQALLMGTIVREMQKQDATFRAMIDRLASLPSLRRKLESVGTTVVTDVLSSTMGVVRRLVASESIKQPFLAELFFEGGVAQRCKMIGEVLMEHKAPSTRMKSAEVQRAGERYFSMIAYFPSMMAQIGMRDQWGEDAVREHVAKETDIFLKAHPAFQ